ncbi:hypothetical protein E6C76_21840 [Pseudothauera nasutitermitis]|uniref:Uncharacterized protein n=1 Tax=Pseudothauera nasutitermitis TaxID=2565930 RepID=A0A4S4ALZ2_9RHOO|nr:hypothetical protein [Pseudothauera nasutitermitis]THF60587.1 hypothetical protein E6C76_21840 [Pseudothauera nasutitermitis]
MTSLASPNKLFAMLLCGSLLGLGAATVEAHGGSRWAQVGPAWGGQRDHRPGYDRHRGPREVVVVRERYYQPPPRVVQRHYYYPPYPAYPAYYDRGYRRAPAPAVVINLPPVVIPLR